MIVRSVSAAEVSSAPPQDEKAAGRFLRLARAQDHTPAALETAIVRFAPADGKRRTPTVDLVAAVHIADRNYYEQLNREFEGYDAVLYELIAPEESKVPLPSSPGSSHPISLLQNGMKDILALEFQLKQIDYTRKNMVHADMSPDEFSDAMRKRGESLMTMLARMIGYALTRQGESGQGADNMQLLLALFDNNRALALKRALAEQFESSEGLMMALEGPAGSTLIDGRNKVALEVLRKEIAAGRQKIAIFYGAAHMSDFQARLREEFGLAPVNTRWLAAWNLKP
jgi:hypothetical protein